MVEAPLNDAEIEDNCVDLARVCHLFGMKMGAAQNMIYDNKFPVPTIRRGRHRVINKKVLADYLKKQDEKAWHEWETMTGKTPSP
jgi:hypothetical protein